MSQWGSCLARLRECVRRLILDEVDEESMGLFESDDKVCVCFAWLGMGTMGGMFVGPPLTHSGCLSFLCGTFDS